LLYRVDTKKSATDFLPLLLILVGVALVAFSLGPYQNWDTQLEFEAASNVVKMGIPYVESFGTFIDQPPLGFYIEAFFFNVFGVSTDTGVPLVTLFGLGSTVLVYLLGMNLYDRSTGLFAAALFGLNTWHLILSRSFLIDTQCLFFSLVCLFVGVSAIRRSSIKLAFVSGLAFAVAMLTKFYAVFILVPLFLFYIHSKPKKLKLVASQTAAFSTPVLVFAVTWYQLFLGRSLLTVFHHNDFLDVIPASTGVVASPFFATNFLIDYGLGPAFIAATVFSLLLAFSLRKHFKTAFVELTCLASIVFVITVNVVLGAGLNLNVPYFSAIKYLYQALPFFALLTASLSTKSLSLFRAAKSTLKHRKLLLYAVATAALVLLAATLISSIYYTNAASPRDYLQFRVERDVDYGYALLNPAPPVAGSMVFQYCGFAMVMFGLLWAGRHKLTRLIKSFYKFPS
jgi:4-amino-4-deoxy-L-arabinose transferase-like glycosyltransferase